MSFSEIINRKNTYCTQWDYIDDRFGQKNLLPFTISDTDFKVPDPVLEKIKNRISHPIFGYTRWNNDDFQNSVVHWFLERFATQVENQWIVYSPTVMYSISLLIQILTNKGDGVIIQTPVYDAFYKTITGNQRKLVENPLIYKNYQYSIDFEDLENKAKNPDNKILLLCSPHNPIGRVWTPNELKKIKDICIKNDLFVISDEIHMDILRKGQRQIPFINYMNERCAIITSGSKVFNFPGLVFSYAIIPDTIIRDKFLYYLKNRDGLSSASILGMVATMTAYQECANWVDDFNRYIDTNIDLTTKYINKYLPKIRVVPSEGTYLMWLDVKQLGLKMDEIQKKLINIGKVAIMDGRVYGKKSANFLRLNVGCPQEKLKNGLRRMQKSLN